MLVTEISTGVAESAGSEIKGEGDILSAFHGFPGEGNGFAGTDAHAHTAADALVGIISNPPAIVRCCLTGNERIHVTAGFAEKLGNCLLYKWEIHSLFVPFLFRFFFFCSFRWCVRVGEGCFLVAGFFLLR